MLFRKIALVCIRKSQYRARLLAHAEPSREARGWMEACRQRVCARLAQERKDQKDPLQTSDSKSRQHALIGQLKAAEARNRIRQKRLQEEILEAQETKLTISCQSDAHSAARLELLLTPQKRMNIPDSLNQRQRRRLEEILADEKDLTIIRT
ncbi:protein LKAAEAR1-like isoform X2 [Brachyhypopomus gauderio]|uniref:protein LKAAEAR1-like isoform X2 n=1 Tax=Brachyhypopomus gauderio TaxID=698409 RepID=UPI004042B00A